MNDQGIHELRTILNTCWTEETIPEGVCQARVALIFKKGDTTDQRNYRLISLLNTVYKILASIVKERIADKLDHLFAKHTICLWKETK